jgi:archaellum biogenesis ATPase FlaH
MTQIEDLILNTLVYKESYARAVIPHLKPEYFDGARKKVYEEILSFIEKYNKLPNETSLKLAYTGRGGDDVSVLECLSLLKEHKPVEESWLIDTSEKWCQERAVHIALMESIRIIDTPNGEERGKIPKILQDALSVTFDNHVGHDYIEDWKNRYDYYHRVEDRLDFDLEMFNKITNGGVPRKTLNVILAGINAGKSLAMCHLAADNLSRGRNVLYITLEMAEERIAERIDANLFDVNINDIASLGRDEFNRKIDRLKKKSHGSLIIKEYPTASAHSGHFRALLQELQLKKNFKPDVVFVDYINICASSRMKGLGGSINTYSMVKAIAEELRGLAVEFNIALWTATQLTRAGFGSSDIEMTDTSESFGLPASADLYIGLMRTEQLDASNQILVKQLKNRYSDPSENKRFVLGLDRPKMRLYDVSDPFSGVMSTPDAKGGAPEGSPFSSREKSTKERFDGFKV